MAEDLDALDPKGSYHAIAQAFREGWETPGMEDYDRYEEAILGRGMASVEDR